MLGLLLVVAMVMVVSCSQDSLAQDNLVSVRFSKLEARAVSNSYTVEGGATWDSESVKIGEVQDYYWTYCAKKMDDGFKTGETYNSTSEVYEFKNWADGAGLSGSKTFSTGSWKFELKAYASDTDRATGTKAIFTGEVTTGKLTSSTTTPINVPMSFTYVEGTGTADFTISTTITSPEGENYAITKVEMVIGETTVELANAANTTNWIKSGVEVASGRHVVSINVYVDGDTKVSKEIGTAYIMHGMTTELKGTATITITGDKQIEITLTPTIPSSLPYRAPSNTVAGDTLTLGILPDAETAVSWKVLAVENKKALIISEKALEKMAHTDNATDTYSWANSKIKSWLNDTSEDGFISQYGLENVSIATVDSEVGNVFILSSDEATTYSCTADVSYVGDNKEYGCWLRTASSSNVYSAVMINPNLIQSISGVTEDKTANNELGVRPVFWIDIE